MLTVILSCLLQVDTLSAALVEERMNTKTFTEAIQVTELPQHSVGESLLLIPDVQLTDYGPTGGKYASARGLGTAHTGVFLDGVLVRDVQNNQVDLSKFNNSSLQSISIYNGQRFELLAPASTFSYGTSLFLKSRVSNRQSLSFSTEYGHFNTLYSNISYNQPIKDHILTVNGQYRRTDGHRENSDLRSYNADINYYYKGLKVKASAYQSHFGTPGSTSWLSDGRQTDKSYNIQASYDRYHNKLAYSLAGKYSRDKLHYVDSYGSNTYNQNTAYLSLATAYTPTTWLSMSLASDLNIANLKTDVQEFPEINRINSTSAANVKVHNEHISLHGTLLYNYIKDNNLTWSNFAPAVTLSYNNKNIDIFLTYKDIFRAPNINELYYPYYSNPNLQPENVSQIDLGFKLKEGDFTASADVYINHVTDKIVSLEPLYIPTNYSNVYGHGLTTYLDYNHQEDKFGINARVSYAYAESQTDGVQLPYTPKHTLTGLIIFRYNNLSATVTDIFKSEMLDAYQSTLPKWNVLNASVDYKFEIKKIYLKVGLAANNLTNKTYEQVPGYPMPGINILGKLEIGF